MHEFQMVRSHLWDSPSVQPVACMNLPRIACVILLLNLTMTTPLAQFHNCMTDNRRTSNLLSMQLRCRDGSVCLALHEILHSSGRQDLGIIVVL